MHQGKIGVVDDGAAYPLRCDQFGIAHVVEVEGQGVVGNVKRGADFSCGCAIIAAADQQAEDLQAGFLR